MGRVNLFKLFQHPQDLVDLSPDQLQGRIQGEPVVIVDVRTPREFESGHIEGAISIPLGHEKTITTRWASDAPMVFICKTGHRSQAAAATVLKLGYTNVAHLKGGMDGWKRAGKPI